jgi:polyhydroxybutyrate depolymerase
MRMIGIFALILALGASTAAAETIDIGGVARTYITQFPGTKPAPLVVALHGNTQTGADMRTRTSWALVANRERFGVIFPDGLNHAWADLRPDTSAPAGRRPPAPTTSPSSSN